MSGKRNLLERVESSANAELVANGSVGPLEVMLRMGWLSHSHFVSWQKGIIPTMIETLQVNPDTLDQALLLFFQWAKSRGMRPVRVPYSRKTPGGEVPLNVTGSEDPEVEEFFHIHYVPNDLSASKTERTIAKLSKPSDLVVFQAVGKSSACTECKTELGKGDFLFLEKGEPLCLSCADLDELEFLPRGDAALTRRAKKYSRLSAVVVRFARARGRYERQGILVTAEAIEKAEQECLSDEEQRMARRAREGAKRAAQDEALVAGMTELIHRMYPHCPTDEAEKIARHTAERGSGRVGRSAAGRSLDEHAIELAVTAWIRHRRSEYDDLLAAGHERAEARQMIRSKVSRVLDDWKGE